MPVPAPVLYPPFNTVRLSHAEPGVTSLAALRRFHVDSLGPQVTHEDAGAIHPRAMEERGHHCVILRQGPAQVGVPRFKVFAAADLDAAHAFFTAHAPEHHRPSGSDVHHRPCCQYRT